MQELAGLINEYTPAPKFNLKYPKTVEDLTMKFLYLGMQNAVNKILADIEKRTGSNANPISLQVIEGWNDVEKKLKKHMNLDGQKALDTFMPIVLGEFQTDAPFISSLMKRYKIDRW